MIHIEKEDIYISEDQYGYCPYRVLIEDTRELNAIADKIQKDKGYLPLFMEDEECDLDNWYDFFFETDGDKVINLCYEYGFGDNPGDDLEIDEETKQNVMEVILNYYGGKEEYELECEKW